MFRIVKVIIMLLKFYIDDEIHRLTHHDINKNITNQVCKCIFNFNEDIWKNEDIYITFIDNNNHGVSMHIGEWQKKICCVVPPSIFKNFCFRIYIHSEGLHTNIVEIKINNHIVPNINFCNHKNIDWLNDIYQRNDHNPILTNDGKIISFW